MATATPALAAHNLGIGEGTCRPNEPGPAVIVNAEGFKDREGILRAELYPPDDSGFLTDDNKLIDSGRTFRRSEMSVPASGPVKICIRAPGPGTYTLALIHDRDGNRKFGLLQDGIGFPGNPKLGHSKPPATEARITVGSGVTETRIVLNYYDGFLSFAPVKHPR